MSTPRWTWTSSISHSKLMRTSARISHYWKHRSVSTLGDIRAHYGASLASSYVQIAVLAIRRIISVKDFGCLKLILLTPLMYTVGFRGMVETGRGRMRSQNRQELRAIMYSTFKTHFCYLRRLAKLSNGNRLDVLLSKHQIDEVDLIKIDVQGHEEHVISGLRNALENGRIKLAIVELHPKRGVSRIAVINRMKSLGYRPVLEDKYLFGQTQLYFELKPHGHSGIEDSNPISLDAQGLPDPTLESRLNPPVPTQS